MPPSKLAVTGFYLYPQDAFELIETLVPSQRGELEVSDLNNAYARAGRLDHHLVTNWFDAGEPEPWARTCRYVQDHPTHFGDGRFRLHAEA